MAIVAVDISSDGDSPQASPSLAVGTSAVTADAGQPYASPYLHTVVNYTKLYQENTFVALYLADLILDPDTLDQLFENSLTLLSLIHI